MKPYRAALRKGVLSMSFPATLENVERACEEMKRISTENGLGRSSFAVRLVLRETLNNAVIHGSKGHPERRVRCQVRWERKNGITIAVEDEGEGFAWRRYLERRVDSRARSGRGIPIMRQYGKEVRFNRKGNRVVVEIDASQGGIYDGDHTG